MSHDVRGAVLAFQFLGRVNCIIVTKLRNGEEPVHPRQQQHDHRNAIVCRFSHQQVNGWPDKIASPFTISDVPHLTKDNTSSQNYFLFETYSIKTPLNLVKHELDRLYRHIALPLPFLCAAEVRHESITMRFKFRFCEVTSRFACGSLSEERLGLAASARYPHA